MWGLGRHRCNFVCGKEIISSKSAPHRLGIRLAPCWSDWSRGSLGITWLLTQGPRTGIRSPPGPARNSCPILSWHGWSWGLLREVGKAPRWEGPRVCASLSWVPPRRLRVHQTHWHVFQIWLGDITGYWPNSGPSTYGTCCDSGQPEMTDYPVLSSLSWNSSWGGGHLVLRQKPGIQSQTNLGSNSVPADCKSLGFSVLGESTWRTIFCGLFQGWGGWGSLPVCILPPSSRRGPCPASESQHPMPASHPEHVVWHEVCECEVYVSLWKAASMNVCAWMWVCKCSSSQQVRHGLPWVT